MRIHKLIAINRVIRALTLAVPSLLRVKLTTCSFFPSPPPCFMIDRSNHSAVEFRRFVQIVCKLRSISDRDTRHDREKLRRIRDDFQHQSSRLRVSSRGKRGDKLEINVRFEKEYYTKEEISIYPP